MLEIALFRQQLIMLDRPVKRPQLSWRERGIMVFLASSVQNLPGTCGGWVRSAKAGGHFCAMPEVKSRRERPKSYDRGGQACMNPRWEYYKDTDADFHARRRDGQRHRCVAIAQWECGACERKHTAGLGTSMYRLKTASERVGLATHLAMKGMSVADISEVTGHSPETIRRV
jgi:hypothetical protein